MTDKDNVKKDDNSEDKSSGNEQPKPPVINPFEQSINDIPPETLENIEQFKEAQTERD